MKFTNFFIVLTILLLSLSINAQDLEEFKELFLKTEAYYKNSDMYSLKVTYQFFEEGNVEALETMQGVIKKKGTDYYSKIGPTEFVYLGQVFLKINHEEKAVLYSKIKDKKTQTPVEVTSLLGYFKKATVVKNKETYTCILTFKKLAILPYKKMILVIDADNYTIIKQELYMLPDKSFPLQGSRDKTKAGKVVINLIPQHKKQNFASVFNLSNYIVGNDEVRLSNKLSTFKLYNTNQ